MCKAFDVRYVKIAPEEKGDEFSNENIFAWRENLNRGQNDGACE